MVNDKQQCPPKIRVYEYTLPGGWTVWAGKSDADNDRLSIKIANPDDWWFHVRGMPGSHVLLRSQPGLEAGRSTIKEAAAIAAFHSKARAGGVVPVAATLAVNVTKPRGAKPGTVNIKKETIIKVRPAIPVEDVPLPSRI